ncbi:hypothetical protein P280DRAFT_516850 [Massarina eburnea CBS 473.64]|uniref:Uncharacterized protein n=1 Tax=Massarina eburnea CBS 473.64 TaxID=1395130 RepID=A0A6A6S1U0_9PLEO|nr:hypothetical protein P280DRAFT_516850 [Massarina eburnea CBS 473.64]
MSNIQHKVNISDDELDKLRRRGMPADAKIIQSVSTMTTKNGKKKTKRQYVYETGHNVQRIASDTLIPARELLKSKPASRSLQDNRYVDRTNHSQPPSDAPLPEITRPRSCPVSPQPAISKLDFELAPCPALPSFESMKKIKKREEKNKKAEIGRTKKHFFWQ